MTKAEQKKVAAIKKALEAAKPVKTETL